MMAYFTVAYMHHSALMRYNSFVMQYMMSLFPIHAVSVSISQAILSS